MHVTRTTPAPLPPPTADELAAIRARLDGRRDRLHQPGPGTLRGLLTVGLPVLLMAGLAALFVGEVRWGIDERWVAVYLAGVVPLIGAASVGRVLRTDAVVAERLGSRGTPGAPAVARLTSVDVAALALVGAVLALVVSSRADDAARSRSAASVAALVAVVLAAGLLTATLARLIGAGQVGDGPVLEAVDAALLRRDLRGVLALPMLTVVAVFSGPGAADDVRPLLALVVVACAALLLQVSARRCGDAALLGDPRLATAEPPDSWLARGAVA